MNMKKKMLFMLLMAMVLGTAGCKNEEPSRETKTTEADTTKSDAAKETTKAEDGTKAEDYSDSDIKNADITIEELYAANNLMALAENHSCMSYTMESHDADGFLLCTMDTQYTMIDGKFGYDAELYIYSEDIPELLTIYSTSYEAENIPGAEYNVMYDEDGNAEYIVFVCPRAEHKKYTTRGWMNSEDDETEELLGAYVKDGILIVESRIVSKNMEGYSDNLYHVDPDTHLLLYAEQTWYNGEGEVRSVDRYTLVYDKPYKEAQQAMLDITSAEDLCYLTIVVDPAGDNMEVNSYQFRKGTDVTFRSEKEFTMYSDEECTQEITYIDTSVDEDTVFIKLKD